MSKLSKFLRRVFPKDPVTAFNSWHYLRHNARRQEHLASLSLPIAGASILEVGAGIGDHTHFFIDRGCQVTTSDARKDNVKILHRRYPEVKVCQLDLDSPPDALADSFDIIYCYGLLYHLSRPAEAIAWMGRHCRKLLLLETCVSFGVEPLLNPCAERARNPTQAASGAGCRPTRPWVHAELKLHFNWVFMPRTQPNHEQFPLDWINAVAESRLKRAVFIASKTELTNPSLTLDIPMRQTRH